MKYRLAKIFLILTLILSVVIILLVLEVIKFNRPWHVVLLYAFITTFTAVISYISLVLAATQKPREVVKVVYKTIEKQPEQEEKEDQQEQQIQRYIEIARKDLAQKQESVEQFSEQLFSNLAEAFNIVIGLLFVWDEQKQKYIPKGRYAYYSVKPDREYELGEGLTGQVAKDKRILYIDNVPEGYIEVVSGLGQGTPRFLILMPIVKNDFSVGVIEFATFEDIPEPKMEILEAVAKAISEVFPNQTADSKQE